ncbi:hypothetical protein ABPG74_019834 [Tetrahymena malaccensis]
MNQIPQELNYELFLINNYQLCPIHNERLGLLQIDDCQNNDLLKCLECFTEQNFKFIPLKLFLNNEFSKIIKGWPILEDSQFFQQLKGISTRENLIQSEIQNVQNYYQSLKKEIINLIDEKEKQTLKNICKNYENFEYPLDLYNQISKKEKLKDIILNQYQNLDKQNELFSQIVKENLQNQENYKKKMLESLDNLNKNTLNLESHYQIKDKIIELIKQLNDFASNEEIFNKSQYNIMNPQIQQEQNVQLVQNLEIKINSIDNLDKIYGFSIVNIKLNYEYINRKDIKDISYIAQALERHQRIDKLILDLKFGKIEDEQAKQIAVGLEKLQNINNLTLGINWSFISIEGAKKISSALEKLQNSTNLNLDFRWSDIQIEGAKQMILALQRLKNLNILALSFYWDDDEAEIVQQLTLDLQKLRNINNLTLKIYKKSFSDEQQNEVCRILKDSLKKAKQLNIKFW